MSRKLALLFAGTMLALALSEGLVRVASWWYWSRSVRAAASETDVGTEVRLRDLIRPSRDRDLVYGLRPNLDVRFKGVSVRTNSLGFREREIQPSSVTSERTILGLGDSVMFGWGVESEDTSLRLVEAGLNRTGRSGVVRSVNCGVPGYNTAMEVAQFEAVGRAFHPDLIILHMVNNDLEPPKFLSTRPSVFSLHRSFLLDLVLDQRPMPRGDGFVDLRELEGFDDRHRTDVDARYRHLSGAESMRKALEKLRQLAGDTPVVCVLLDRDAEPWKTMAEAAERSGFSVVVTKTVFSAALADLYDHPDASAWKETFWLSGKDPHPNEFAHQLVAQSLFDVIQQKGLLAPKE